MSRRVRCPSCNSLNKKEEAQKISNRYYCHGCAEVRLAEKERNTDGWSELFDYICELYNIDRPTGMMFRQLKEFRREYDYTNMGIFLTLKYYYEVLENEVKEDTGLGIVVYFYERARKHYMEIIEAKKHLKDFKIDEKEIVVQVNDKPIESYRRKKIIPFDDVSGEAGE